MSFFVFDVPNVESFIFVIISKFYRSTAAKLALKLKLQLRNVPLEIEA